MILRFARFPLFALLCTALLTLSGCLYDYAPSGPVKDIDTSLVGQWATTDKSGHLFTAVVRPSDVDHYSIEFTQQGKGVQEFSGWISRVDSFSILVLKCQDEGSDFGKFALYHYEALTPGVAPPGGIGAKRIRLSELELDDSTHTMDSYQLRVAIRKALKAGTLLVPHDVVADLKTKNEAIPGSVIWTKTGGVTLSGETF